MTPEWYAANKDAINAAKRADRAAMRRKNLWHAHKLTIEQYEAILAEQGGVCAICEKPETVIDPRYGTTRSLAVDHDHTCCPTKSSCGQCVRGLLCTACNHGIGRFEDDPTLLTAAIAYLTREEEAA